MCPWRKNSKQGRTTIVHRYQILHMVVHITLLRQMVFGVHVSDAIFWKELHVKQRSCVCDTTQQAWHVDICVTTPSSEKKRLSRIIFFCVSSRVSYLAMSFMFPGNIRNLTLEGRAESKVRKKSHFGGPCRVQSEKKNLTLEGRAESKVRKNISLWRVVLQIICCRRVSVHGVRHTHAHYVDMLVRLIVQGKLSLSALYVYT